MAINRFVIALIIVLISNLVIPDVTVQAQARNGTITGAVVDHMANSI